MDNCWSFFKVFYILFAILCLLVCYLFLNNLIRYSTMLFTIFICFGSSSNESANKVREAVAYLHNYYPDLIVDGEIQSDFALNPEMLKAKFPFSKLAGKKVNTLIFPNLEAANITYKLLKELYKVDSIGPIMLGMEKAVHIFQLGASVEEMVNMVAVAVVDAQEKEKRKKMSAK
jgi:malate dehydrogenase (oxaloacetate-decarboxylating)(NADP+)